MTSKNSAQSLWVGISFLVVGLGLGLVWNSGGAALLNGGVEDGAGSNEAAVPQLDPATLQIVSVSMDNDAVLGDINAPVTIVEFSDFQCPYCTDFVTKTYPSLKKDYIDTGIVKLIYRDFPLPSHGDASLAAQAAECARKYVIGRDPAAAGQDETFFAMHDLLFESQRSWSNNPEAKTFIEALAKDNLGVDISACLDSEEMKAEVEADYTAGRSYGVSGTPTFFINGKKLVGAWPYEVFEKVIESVR